MRHTMGVIPFLLALGAAPAAATPAYYTIDFTLTQGSPLPASGGFFYDASTSTFTNLIVTWDGYTFDVTAPANSLAFTSPTDPCYSGASTGSQEAFLLLTTCSGDANPSYQTNAPYYLADVYPYGSPNYTEFSFYTWDILGSGPNHIVFGGPAEGTSSCPPLTCYTYSVQAVGAFAATPEPGTWAFTLIGLGLALRKRLA